MFDEGQPAEECAEVVDASSPEKVVQHQRWIGLITTLARFEELFATPLNVARNAAEG